MKSNKIWALIGFISAFSLLFYILNPSFFHNLFGIENNEKPGEDALSKAIDSDVNQFFIDATTSWEKTINHHGQLEA